MTDDGARAHTCPASSSCCGKALISTPSLQQPPGTPPPPRPAGTAPPPLSEHPQHPATRHRPLLTVEEKCAVSTHTTGAHCVPSTDSGCGSTGCLPVAGMMP
eukprot:COSAG01_NODE_1061_length_11887_cov_151.517557_7_plen_102_part_00